MNTKTFNAEHFNKETERVISEQKITYGISEEIYELGGEMRRSYGIVGYADADEEKSHAIVVSARDVSCEKEAVETLAALCNRLGISPLHLDDVVDDFLNCTNV